MPTFFQTTLDTLDQLAVSAILETQIEDKASGEKLRLKTSSVQQEKTRNRFPLKTIMDQNPQSYKEIRRRYRQKILAAQGKHDVFQFHLNTLGNLIDLSLDVVYDIQKQYHSTSSSTQEINKVTPSSASAATNQSTEEEENTQKGKEKCTAEEKGTPPPSQSTITGAAKTNEETDRPRGTSAKRALFD
ncbi:hypothetical protein Tco_1482332 [Tanacetum coccineum]